MAARPLMTADEIKRIKKGSFVVLKTGAYPMKVDIPLFKKWGITFEEDCVPENKNIKIPQYISINELKEKIVDSVLESEPANKHFKKKTVLHKSINECM